MHITCQTLSWGNYPFRWFEARDRWIWSRLHITLHAYHMLLTKITCAKRRTLLTPRTEGLAQRSLKALKLCGNEVASDEQALTVLSYFVYGI